MRSYNVDAFLRPVLMGLSAVILLWGGSVLWDAARIANQEYLHLVPDSVTIVDIHMFGRPVTMWQAMLFHALIGVLICWVAIGMFAAATGDNASEADSF